MCAHILEEDVTSLKDGKEHDMCDLDKEHKEAATQLRNSGLSQRLMADLFDLYLDDIDEHSKEVALEKLASSIKDELECLSDD
jgi:hypothetical protein